MLLNNVADFTTEGSEEIRDLFVMQQVQVRIPAQWLYYFVVFRYLATCLICFVEPQESNNYLRAHETTVLQAQKIEEENESSRVRAKPYKA